MGHLSLFAKEWRMGLRKSLPIGVSAARVVERIVEVHSEICEFRILEYNYVPHALDDPNRIERWVSASEVRNKGLSSVLKERAPAEWDIAMYSHVRLRTGTLRHIPLMDFKSCLDSKQLGNLKGLWADVVGRPGYLLGTDNSYHWYGTELLTHGEWVKFMGRALLCNLDDQQTVDVRYVGHRLFAGCGSLRLVGNAKRRTKDPILREIWCN